MNEDICPFYDRCFVSTIMRSIQIPHLKQYCQQGYTNCRYYSGLVKMEYSKKQAEEAPAV